MKSRSLTSFGMTNFFVGGKPKPQEPEETKRLLDGDLELGGGLVVGVGGVEGVGGCGCWGDLH